MPPVITPLHFWINFFQLWGWVAKTSPNSALLRHWCHENVILSLQLLNIQPDKNPGCFSRALDLLWQWFRICKIHSKTLNRLMCLLNAPQSHSPPISSTNAPTTPNRPKHHYPKKPHSPLIRRKSRSAKSPWCYLRGFFIFLRKSPFDSLRRLCHNYANWGKQLQVLMCGNWLYTARKTLVYLQISPRKLERSVLWQVYKKL